MEDIQEYFSIRLPMSELAKHLIWIDPTLTDLIEQTVQERIDKAIEEALVASEQTIASVVDRRLIELNKEN